LLTQLDITPPLGRWFPKLKGLGIHVEKVDEQEGGIEARCFGLAADWIFWKCWSDRILLKFERVSEGTTKVKVYAIPNLLIVRPLSKEKVIDFQTLASQLTNVP
jgi:hypothetical protein